MIKPLGARLLVKELDKKEITLAGGIVLAPGWDNAPQSIQGEVVLAGPECEAVKPGDVILLPAFAPTQARELPSDKTYIVAEEDVLAVVTPEKPAK